MSTFQVFVVRVPDADQAVRGPSIGVPETATVHVRLRTSGVVGYLASAQYAVQGDRNRMEIDSRELLVPLSVRTLADIYFSASGLADWEILVNEAKT